MEIREFLRRVWGDQEGWAFLGYGTSRDNFIEKAYRYPKDLDKYIADATRQNVWANVYFCAHLCTEKRRIKETAVSDIYALWMDHDTGYPERLDPRPSVCWQTSDGRFQAVWLLDNPVTPHDAELMNKHLYQKYGADSKWYLTTYLRLPKTINHKYTDPYQGFFLWTDGGTFDVDTLISAEPPDMTDIDLTYTRGIPADLPSYAQVIAKYGRYIPQAVWRLIEEPPGEDSDWSENLWKLERLLIEARIPPEDVFVIVRESPWNKYRRDNRPEEHLWLEIHKAYHDKPPPSEDKGMRWFDMPRLMTFSERPTWLVKDIWIDHTVGFAAGVGKSYKSTLTMDLALSIASGTPFLDRFEVVNPGPVLMVQEEDPLWRVAHRVQVMAEHKGLTGTSMDLSQGNILLEINPMPEVPFYTAVGSGFAFTEREKCEALEDAIDRYRPRILFLDPLFMLNPGMDEYKSGDMVFALNMMKYWRNKYGCAICVVHHFRKGEGAANERLYGSMALYAWSESNLWFHRGEGNVVTITRDIKDASRDLPKINVTVNDFAESYDFSVSTDEPIVTNVTLGFQKVFQVLRAYPVGSLVSRSELDQQTGLTRKTTTAILKNMADMEMVKMMKASGRGAPVHVYTLNRLYEDIPEVEVRL